MRFCICAAAPKTVCSSWPSGRSAMSRPGSSCRSHTPPLIASSASLAAAAISASPCARLAACSYATFAPM
eukprot:6734260-Prymnesium_polylepis.1